MSKETGVVSLFLTCVNLCFETIARPEQPSGPISPSQLVHWWHKRVIKYLDISTKKGVKVFKNLLTNDEAASHLVRIVEVHDLCHVVVGWNEALYESMIRSHPEFLQQVDVVLLLLKQFPNGLHSQRLVLGPKGCWYAPDVEGHQLEDNGSN